MGSYIARTYSSERVSSSHGPDIFYEFVHAQVKHSPNDPVGTDVVLIRMVQGERSEFATIPEVHVQDLMEVEERFLTFMDRVRKKSGDTASMGAIGMPHPGSQVSPVQGVPVVAQPAPQIHIVQMPMAAPQPLPQPVPQQPAPVAPDPTPPPQEFPGRFAPGTPRKKPTGAPDAATPAAVAMGPKKASFGIGPGGQILGGRGEEAAATEEQQGPTMSSYEILPFTLQRPPELDQVMRILSGDPQRLVVVARTELTDKIKIYLDNVIKGDGALAQKSGAFSAIVVHRQGGRMNFKQKMMGPVALAIQQIVSNPTKVLWVPPEGA